MGTDSTGTAQLSRSSAASPPAQRARIQRQGRRAKLQLWAGTQAPPDAPHPISVPSVGAAGVRNHDPGAKPQRCTRVHQLPGPRQGRTEPMNFQHSCGFLFHLI